MHRDEIERQEIVQELPALLAAVQQVGQTLTNKSHGIDYHLASEFNELLHLARLKLDEIQIETEIAGGGRPVAGNDYAPSSRPRLF